MLSSIPEPPPLPPADDARSLFFPLERASRFVIVISNFKLGEMEDVWQESERSRENLEPDPGDMKGNGVVRPREIRQRCQLWMAGSKRATNDETGCGRAREARRRKKAKRQKGGHSVESCQCKEQPTVSLHFPCERVDVIFAKRCA